MKYPVACECGATHQVSGGDAGTTLSCTCGRKFDIPPLHILRSEAGQATIAPEIVVESLLAEGDFPRNLIVLVATHVPTIFAMSI